MAFELIIIQKREPHWSLTSCLCRSEFLHIFCWKVADGDPANLVIRKHIEANRNHVKIVRKTCKVVHHYKSIFSNLDRTMLTHIAVIFHTATSLFQSPCLTKISDFETPDASFREHLWSKIVISNAQQWYCNSNYISMTSHLGHFLNCDCRLAATE